MAINSALLAKLKTSKNKYSRGTNSVKLKEGKTTIRLLQKGTEEFWREIGVHWIKTEKDGKPVAVHGCMDEVYGKPCAICTAIDEAMKSATDEEKAIIKEWRAKKSVLVAALIRSGSDASNDPVVLELTGTTWQKLSGTIEEYAMQDIDALDSANGIDFVVERVGKGLNTEYNVMVAPRSQPVTKDVYDRLPDLDAYIERELFKDGERKALTAIGNFSGINVGGLTALAPARNTAALLSSSVVEDAIVEETVTAPAKVEVIEDPEIAEIVEEVQVPTESEEDRELREMEEKMAAIKAKKAKEAAEKAAASAAKPAPATKAAAPATTAAPKADAFTASSEDEINAMLADLDNA